jgi:endonuclease YncB( thermonuclease family)
VVAVIAVLAYVLEPALSPLNGRAEAVDGDTLRIGSTRVRLIGIDAPELDQTCTDAAGAEWACGRQARAFVVKLIGKSPVDCARHGRDRYGRALAACTVEGADLGQAIVDAGWAVAELQYVPAELGARAAGRGIWAGSFETPADWRRDHGADRFDLLNWLRGWFP